MTTLHQVFCGKWPTALERLYSPGDTVLLAGASVALAINPHNALAHFLQRVGSGITCVALDDAVVLRGLQMHWPTSISRISEAEWVDLVCRHAKSVSW